MHLLITIAIAKIGANENMFKLKNRRFKCQKVVKRKDKKYINIFD